MARPAPLSLLCLPCAGGSASMYLRWQRALPRWVRLVPVELPGRGVRMSEFFVEHFEDLVEQLCEEHERHCGGSYALYGHSMGALIACGMTMRWRALHKRLPEMLFASASPAPCHRDPAYFADKDTDAALIAELRKQGGTPDAVFDNTEMLHITLQALRADFRICMGYRYRTTQPLSIPIHVFAGQQDDIAADRIRAWEAETSSSFSVRWFDGDHFFIRQHESAVLNFVVRHLLTKSSEVSGASALSA